jgi:hypothetical protein
MDQLVQTIKKLTIDLSPVYSLVGVIVSSGIVMFAIRKVIKLVNRS